VKHNLCYWIGNKPHKTSDFSKLQQTPKFNDNLRITDTDIFIFVHKCVYSFHMCYTRFDAYSNHMHITMIVKNNLLKNKENRNKIKQKNTAAQIETSVRARGFNAGLLARSHFQSGRSCDRPTRSRFSVVFLGRRANAELVPKFHVALHASHAALPMVT
jgi:hypothetical protein